MLIHVYKWSGIFCCVFVQKKERNMNHLKRLLLPCLYLFETCEALFFDFDIGRVIIFLPIFTFETYRRQYYEGSCKASISPRDIIWGEGYLPLLIFQTIYFFELHILKWKQFAINMLF